MMRSRSCEISAWKPKDSVAILAEDVEELEGREKGGGVDAQGDGRVDWEASFYTKNLCD